MGSEMCIRDRFVIASDRDDSFDERKAVMIEVESNTGRRIVRVLNITARATDDYDYIQSDVTLNDAETLPVWVIRTV